MVSATPNTLLQLGSHQVAVRTEGGFIQAATRTVRLSFGPHLYAAKQGIPKPDEKVVPYQPGYMLLAAAMGATLCVPPSIKDPASGELVANPRVEFVPGSSVIRSVTATAVCVARDHFGKWHASIQTISIDSESVLRQALLKIEREEVMQVLSDAEVAAERAEGKLRGWVSVPFMPGFQLVGKASAAPVREALQTYNNLSATVRQRAGSKAERLACDHNPVMRMIWTYGDLLIDVQEQKTGKIRTTTTLAGCRDGEVQVSLPYAEVEVVAWTESRGQAALDAFVQQLASQQQVEGVDTIVGESAGEDEIDQDLVDDEPRQITEKPQIPPVNGKLSPVPVAAPAPIVVAAPAPVPVAAPAPQAAPSQSFGQEVSPDVLALQARCAKLEKQLPGADVAHARKAVGLPGLPSDCLDARLLRSYQSELSACLEAMK